MLGERIDGADVEPPKAICSVILHHPGDDALADNDCENLLQAAWSGNFFWDRSHPVWTSVPSLQKKKKKKKKKKQRQQNKIAKGGKGQDAKCNDIIDLRIRYLWRLEEGAL